MIKMRFAAWALSLTVLSSGCETNAQEKSQMSPAQVTKAIKDIGGFAIPPQSIVSTFGELEPRGERQYVILFRVSDPLPPGISLKDAYPFNPKTNDFEITQKQLARKFGVRTKLKKGRAKVVDHPEEGVLCYLDFLEFDGGEQYLMLRVSDLRKEKK